MGRNYAAYAAQLEALRRVAPDASEYWLARDLQPLLAYDTWRSFEGVIEKARLAAASAGVDPRKHFAETSKMVAIGTIASRTQRGIVDWFLSRYACYLIAMNADGAKSEVGHAQTYFAIQTRSQELEGQLTEQEKRAALRERVKDANKKLSDADCQGDDSRRGETRGPAGRYAAHIANLARSVRAICPAARL